ncbi:MAG: citrate lyase acyl carrier protein [Bacteroidota bacterium]
MKPVKKKSGNAGRNGTTIRSDCFVQIELTTRGGIAIDLNSKVKSMYGSSIQAQVKSILSYYGIVNAHVTMEDQGAVPFVIASRVEAAIKRAMPGVEKDFIDTSLKPSKKTVRDRLRRSRLYLPGNEPHYFLNAGLHKPDCIILDLEDSVAPSEKDTARILVRNALMNVDFGASEKMVRINPFPMGLEDLRMVVPHNVQVILIPKCESAEQIIEIDAAIDLLLSRNAIKRNLFLLPIIESALGVERAYAIASASTWICALSIGLEDYTADIGVARTKTGKESLFARSAVINAAKAAGIQALDSVFSDVNDDEGLRSSVIEAKAIGFDGKGCIHPRQIPIVHEAFSPTADEINYAQRVLEAFALAQKNGSGVVALGSKMIDAPVVKRAHRTLALASSTSKK